MNNHNIKLLIYEMITFVFRGQVCTLTSVMDKDIPLSLQSLISSGSHKMYQQGVMRHNRAIKLLAVYVKDAQVGLNVC